ncbi:RDD family protein [Acinetobacter sp. C32I]|uniref:RDD family protein n=1 Tax=Acinetobacter sp. C32I TaxID=2950074 RepID=UPI0020369D77|nr:RDD family protein [Acinetobacter sp. C32I]USA54399.1 RDD family protein [Acinetobacter sp. C32I]
MEFLPTEVDNEKVYAGFWKRLAAAIIDSLILIPFMVIAHHTQSISIISSMITLVISAVLFSVYVIYFHYRFGATLGKMAIKIKITCPNGSKISLKQALIRSSIDIGFSLLTVIAQLIALKHADPTIYLNAGFTDRAKYILLLYPAWYSLVSTLSQVWWWSEFITLLFNKRKRAIHDFMAGTVVIKKQYENKEITTSLNSITANH